MKKLIGIALALCMFAITGCWEIDKDPKDIAKTLGFTTGVACQVTLNDAQKEAILNIVEEVRASKAFISSDAATVLGPIVTRVVQKYVDEGKLTAEASIVVIKVMDVVAKGIDYMFTKHPDWKKHVITTLEVVNAFCDGFNEVIKSKDDKLVSSIKLDTELMNYLNK